MQTKCSKVILAEVGIPCILTLYNHYSCAFPSIFFLEGREKIMYKSKLQQLCHRNRWPLPIYSGMRDGPEHNLRFKASVLVSGTNFDTINICKSLKEACNEAAKLAFLHFSSGSLNFSAEIDAEEQKSDRTQKRPEIHPDSLDMERDLQQKFKTKLQIYAQRKGLPLYWSTREGPPNSFCFRAIVIVSGDSFESPGSHKTISQAEDAAAQVALMALSTDAFQENDIGLYKNLLQEFAQNQGFFMPQYKTTRTGEAHGPTFYATVEVEGETFQGNPAKSKKQAELNAAKVAYTAFMHHMIGNHKSESQMLSTSGVRYEAPNEVSKGRFLQTDDFSCSTLEDVVLKLTPHTSLHRIVNATGNLKSVCPTVSTSTAKYETQKEASKDGDEETVFDKNIPAKTKFKTMENSLVSSYKDSSTVKMTTEIKSYLLNNRIRVYTSIPDVASPKGNVVLPIAEGKWVVVSLEFPN